MILLVDNYDSFVYNIYHYIASINSNIIVKRNDEFSIKDIAEWKVTHIILSPGPKHPNNAGICIDLIRKFYTEIPILGICLGHQAIAVAFHYQVIERQPVMHGKTSEITHYSGRLFANIPNRFTATRYHSLIIESIGQEFKVTAKSDDNLIMAIEHIKYPLFGVQYHPESILSNYGMQHFRNFLSIN